MGQEDGEVSEKLKSSSSTGVTAENVFCTQLRGECTQQLVRRMVWGAVIRGYLSFSGLFLLYYGWRLRNLGTSQAREELAHGGTSEGPVYTGKF